MTQDKDMLIDLAVGLSGMGPDNFDLREFERMVLALAEFVAKPDPGPSHTGKEGDTP